MRHIPNLLTILRLIATPIIIERILARDLDTALILFFLSGISDGLDGFLARRFGWASRLGSIIDPIADKTLVTGVYLALGYRGYFPPWLVGVVIFRDMAILLAAFYLKFSNRLTEFPPSLLGKLSTTVQLLTAGAILLRWPPDPSPFFYATFLLVVFSSLHYSWQIYRKLN